MKVTNVNIRMIPSTKSPTRAYVDVEFDGILVIKNFRVVEGKNGIFFACPSEKNKDGKFFDTVLFKDARKEGTPGNEYYNKLTSGILKQWKEKTNEKPEGAGFDQTRPQDDDCPF